MPTYQYRCTDCDRDLEVVQKFSDPSLTECPSCSGTLRKVYNAVGVVFKGSGFYRTDSRAATNGEVGVESKGSETAGGDKAGEKSADKPEKKAETPAAAKTESSKGDGKREATGKAAAGGGSGSSTSAKAAAR